MSHIWTAGYADIPSETKGARGLERVVSQYPITQARDQVLCSLPELAGGRYDCVLMVDGNVYSTTDLILATR